MFKRAYCVIIVMLFAGVTIFCNDDVINEWLAKQPIKVDERVQRFDVVVVNVNNKQIILSGGPTLMHIASAEGRLDVMKWLKEQDVDINTKNRYGWAPMHVAAMSGKLDVMIWLKEQGVDVDDKVNNGRNPMNGAATSGELDVMKLLKDQGTHVIVKDNDSMQMQLARTSGNYGSTPMYCVARGGQLEVMKWLKDQGADIPCLPETHNYTTSLISYKSLEN